MGVWAVMVLAAAVRMATPAAHFQHGLFIPPDADSAYHLRRARTVFEDPVGVPSIVDPWLGFPQGATVPWSPGWDQFVAFCGWVFGGFKTEGLGVDVGMALAPLIVGVATVVLAHRLADRLFGAWAGLGAGLFCALAPQHAHLAAPALRVERGHSVNLAGLQVLHHLAHQARPERNLAAAAKPISGPPSF